MASNSMPKQRKKPIHYSFISIDEETCTTSHAEPTPTPTPQCFTLLQQFYNELMIPTFPLEEERDDIEDWFECFLLQRKLRLHKAKLRQRKEVKDALSEGLGEEGIANVVQQFAASTIINNGDEEGDCEFDGPAMDVILMVQDVPADDEKDDGRYFIKRSSNSLLLRTQSSLYGGLYAPKEETINASAESRTDSLLSQSSTITEGEVMDENTIGKCNGNNGTNQELSSIQHQDGSQRSLLRTQSSMYGGLYAPTHDEDDEESKEKKKKKYIIIGGAAVEYYKQSRVGLLSYVVLHSEFRGCGLAKFLHNEALSRLEMLANSYGHQAPESLESSSQQNLPNNNSQQKQQPLLQAIFAETNTPAAGDVTPEQSLLRHKSLYNLGYRLVNFPYAQPPLTTEDVNASFDDIVLLVYFPFDENDIREDLNGTGSGIEGGVCVDFEKEQLIKRFCPWYLEGQRNNRDGKSEGNTHMAHINVGIPFGYIEDFYQSVFGYESIQENNNNEPQSVLEGGQQSNNEEGEGMIPDYRTANYYKLSYWFTHKRQQNSEYKGTVKVSMPRPTKPWSDCKNGLLIEWKECQDQEEV